VFHPTIRALPSSRDPLAAVLLVLAAALAVLSLSLAALPLPTLKRLLFVESHWRTERVATFVDGNRIDIVVTGVGALLVTLVAVVLLPTVAG
jgi:hypothetical protein